jgi:hypothetical protein
MKWLILASAIFVVGCSTPTPDPVRPIVIDSQPITRPSLTLPLVDRYNARNVEWIIITPENAEEVFSDISQTGKPVVVFALTEEGYENISLNTSEALRVILQQQSVIDGYRAYYIRVDGSIAAHNANQ